MELLIFLWGMKREESQAPPINAVWRRHINPLRKIPATIKTSRCENNPTMYLSIIHPFAIATNKNHKTLPWKPDNLHYKQHYLPIKNMCLFSTTKKPYVRNFNDAPPHQSYYSARPDGLNATEMRLPRESFHRHSGHYDRAVVLAERPRRTSREVIEYRRSEDSIRLPRGYERREVRRVERY